MRSAHIGANRFKLREGNTMSLVGMLLLAAIVVLGIYAVVAYNGLVALKHNVSKAWANIDVLLKQRHDELPKLIDTCRTYMTFEQETLDKVMRARSGVASAQAARDVSALSAADGELRAGLGKLFALVENYPDLKSNENFLHLQARITGLENAIADRREFYNESVNVNNVRIEQFPDRMIAGWFRFAPAELLRVPDEEKGDVSVGALFRG